LLLTRQERRLTFNTVSLHVILQIDQAVENCLWMWHERASDGVLTVSRLLRGNANRAKPCSSSYKSLSSNLLRLFHYLNSAFWGLRSLELHRDTEWQRRRREVHGVQALGVSWVRKYLRATPARQAAKCGEPGEPTLPLAVAPAADVNRKSDGRTRERSW
jgi:hypothetical protein